MIAGKHAIVTGGGTGIGLAIARALDDAGVRVSIVSRSGHPGDERYYHAAADVTNEAAIAQAFENCRQMYGDIAILVNSAGIAESAPLSRTDPAMWERIIGTNLTGTYLCTRAVFPAMRAAKWGRVVNIASTAGLQGAPYISAYCASKHGVVGFTRAVAAEWSGTGVTANAICPGYTESPMLEQSAQNIMRKTGLSAERARENLAQTNRGGRLVAADEVAEAVLALCRGEQNGMEIVLPP